MDENRRRNSDTELALLKQSFENMREHASHREAANEKRMASLEHEIEALKSDREKLSGGIIFVTAIGGVLLWLVTFGNNVFKAMGKS